MPVYVYKAVTSNGLVVKNRVEEPSKQILIKKLKRNNLTPIDIILSRAPMKKNQNTRLAKRNTTNIEDILKNVNTANLDQSRKHMSTLEKINASLARTEKIRTRDIVIFTQNFYLLKKANFNNIHALSTIIESTENLGFRAILEDILAGVEAGESMYATMEYYEHVFPYIYINMIKVGELSGSLTNSLQQAVKYLDNAADITRKLKRILIPNVIMFALLLVLLVVASVVAVPAMENLLSSVGSTDTLPAMTIWFKNFLNMVIQYWYIPVFLITGVVGSIIYYINTPKGKYNFHYFKYKAPIFGKLMYALDFSRLMRGMLLNLQNGMRIQEAIEVSKNVIRNYVMLSIIETSINNILIGQSWIEPFERSGLSSSMTTEMLKIGMQTDLGEMMEKLLEYMDIDIDNIMVKIMAVLPQVVYSIVGIVLIFVVIVVLVPAIQLYMGNFLFSAAGI